MSFCPNTTVLVQYLFFWSLFLAPSAWGQAGLRAAASGVASNSPGLLPVRLGKHDSLSWATTGGHIL